MRYVLLFITMVLFLCSCARVKIEDQMWCGDAGTQGAFCYHTLADGETIIPQPDWDDMRFGQICTADPPGDKGRTFAQIKTWIEQLCSFSKRCTYPDVKKMLQFLDRAERFGRRATR